MRRYKDERGQSLVELAISLLVLLYLLSGAVEFGLAFFQFVQLRDAAQEGALYASLNPADTAGIETRVRDASSSPIDLAATSGPNAVTVTQTFSGAKCEGNAVTITVSYDHKIFMPFIPQLLSVTTIPLHGSVTDTILSPLCTP